LYKTIFHHPTENSKTTDKAEKLPGIRPVSIPAVHIRPGGIAGQRIALGLDKSIHAIAISGQYLTRLRGKPGLNLPGFTRKPQTTGGNVYIYESLPVNRRHRPVATRNRLSIVFKRRAAWIYPTARKASGELLAKYVVSDSGR
jgi:hypothetical protein